MSIINKIDNSNFIAFLIIALVFTGCGLAAWIEESVNGDARAAQALERERAHEAAYQVEIIVDRVNYEEKSIAWPELDPWGRVYCVEFLKNTRRLEVRSAGSDGKLYTQDDLVAVREIP